MKRSVRMKQHHADDRRRSITCTGFSAGALVIGTCADAEHAQSTVFTVSRKARVLHRRPPSALPAAPCDLEEGVRQRDRVDVLRQLRVDHEHHRHLPRLARLQRLLREAEALELVEDCAGACGA